MIEPRLRLQLLKETRAKLIPLVMVAWGLKIGGETEAVQHQRLGVWFDERVNALRSVTAEASPTGDSPHERAAKAVSGFFSDFPAPQAFATILASAEIFRETGGELARLAGPMEAILRRHLGPDLDAAGRVLTTVWLLVKQGR